MIAWIALSVWPVISIVIFQLARVTVAVPVVLIGGYLLLPELTQVNLPILPTLDKRSVPALMALLLTAIACRADRNGQMPAGVRPGWIPRDRVVQLLLVILVIGVFGTVLTNGDSLQFGKTRLPALRIYDSLAAGLIILMLLLPFFLGRKVLSSLAGQKDLLNVLLVLAVAYSVLALWEIRMSPQLNRMVYGFFPHSWDQHIRNGSFRPLVFLVHGLWLAIFFASAVVAAAAAARTSDRKARLKYGLVAAWLFLTLFLSNSFGAFLIVSILLPVALFLPRRIQVAIGASITAVVLLYPALRAADLVPTHLIVSTVEQINPARAQSLNTRITQEDALLERARMRPAFGWGGWNRSRVFSESGRDLSITDGRWVILFGQGGWFRYVGEFGLLCWGVLMMFFRQRRLPDPISIALALALVANLIDLIPNAGFSPLTWLLAGALVGRLEQGAEQADGPERADAPTRRTPQLRRDLGSAPHQVASKRRAPAGTYRRDGAHNISRGEN